MNANPVIDVRQLIINRLERLRSEPKEKLQAGGAEGDGS